MPSGYTSKIYDGKDVKFKDFVLNCARAFGAFIHLRDEPIDYKLTEHDFNQKPSDYHIKRQEEIKENLKELLKLRNDELEIIAKQNYKKERKRILDQIDKNIKLKDRYINMLGQVKDWKCEEPYINLKNFMIEQLKSSIDFDCSISYYQQELKELKKQTGKQYFKTMKEIYERDIKYHIDEYQKDELRCNERNKWISGLLKLL